jgi:hypothetical protein
VSRGKRLRKKGLYNIGRFHVLLFGQLLVFLYPYYPVIGTADFALPLLEMWWW